ncbi:MAG: ABC transporter ATP-binding protein, partial [Eubacteriales bacterium]
MNYDKKMLKRFVSYYKPHKTLFFMDLIAAFLMAGIELCYPVFTTRVIDDYIPNGMLLSIMTTVGVLLGLYIIMAGLNYFVNYWG